MMKTKKCIKITNFTTYKMQTSKNTPTVGGMHIGETVSKSLPNLL